MESTCIVSTYPSFPQVNRAVAARLLAQQQLEEDQQQQQEDEPAAKKHKTSDTNPMLDDRFKVMFEDEAFAVDEHSDEYRLLHPNVGVKKGGVREPTQQERLLAEHFQVGAATVLEYVYGQDCSRQ